MLGGKEGEREGGREGGRARKGKKVKGRGKRRGRGSLSTPTKGHTHFLALFILPHKMQSTFISSHQQVCSERPTMLYRENEGLVQWV